MGQNTLSQETVRKLCETAVAMRQKSYVPYSHFRVGAALLTEEGEMAFAKALGETVYVKPSTKKQQDYREAVFTYLKFIGRHSK